MNNNKEFVWDEKTVFDFFMYMATKEESVWKMIEDFKKLKSKETNKDYEVTCLSHDGLSYYDAVVIYNFLNGDGRYSNFKIESVRRLSDGEVFTVGDKIEYCACDRNDFKWDGTVKEISISPNCKSNLIFKIQGDTAEDDAEKHIENIRHKKRKSLFTTSQIEEIIEIVEKNFFVNKNLNVKNK